MLAKLLDEVGAVEIKELRSNHVSHYSLPDGKRMIVIGENLHYYDEDGDWKRTNPILKILDKNHFVVDNSPYYCEINDKRIQIINKKNNHGIVFFTTGQPRIFSNYVISQFDKYKWLIDFRNNGFRTRLRIKNRIGKQQFAFFYEVIGDVELALARNGDIVALDGSFHVKKPLVISKDGSVIDQLRWQLESDNKMYFEIDDGTYLDSVYPYIIDPDISIYPSVDGEAGASGTLFWPPVENFYVDTESDILSVSCSAIQNIYIKKRIFFDFELRGIPENAVIDNGILVIYVVDKSTLSSQLYGFWQDFGSSYDMSDFTQTLNNACCEPISWSSLQNGNYIQISLQNLPQTPPSNLRMVFTLDESQTPSGSRFVNFASSESRNIPFLAITYSLPSVEGEASVFCIANINANGIIAKLGIAGVHAVCHSDALANIAISNYGIAICSVDAVLTGNVPIIGFGDAYCTVDTLAIGTVPITPEKFKVICLCDAIGDASLGYSVSGKIFCMAIAEGSGTNAKAGNANVYCVATIFALGNTIFSENVVVDCSVSVSGNGFVAGLRYGSALASAIIEKADGIVAIGDVVRIRCSCNALGVGNTLFENRISEINFPIPAFPRPPMQLEELPYWADAITVAVDSVIRDLIKNSYSMIKSGLLAQRPEASGSFTFYWAVDDNNGAGRMYFDDGQWRPV